MNIKVGISKVAPAVLLAVFIGIQSLFALGDNDALEKLRADINIQISTAIKLPEVLSGNIVKDCGILYKKIPKGTSRDDVIRLLSCVQNENKRVFEIHEMASGQIYFVTRMKNSKYSIEHLIKLSFFGGKLESLNVSISYLEL